MAKTVIPNYINRVEVNGTEYEIVGPAGRHAISALTSNELLDTGYWLSNHSDPMTPQFHWRRTGESGSYEYDLVIVASDPTSLEYTQAS